MAILCHATSMRLTPLFTAGLVLTALAAITLFLLPVEAANWSMAAGFGLATGLALVGAGYALKA
ncbi:hypothetical protein D3C73_1658270 [compost metagenome]